jgi:uncharacterized protein YndB with AHSA1/START domain
MTSKPFILTRTFDAPRKLVWETMTDAEHLKHWFGPTGQLDYASVDLREGGVFLYGIAAPDGRIMRAKRTFTDIKPPEKFVSIACYCDEAENVTRHPMSPTWPLEMLIATTLTETGGKTHMLLEWSAHNATPEEQATFDASHGMLNQGWSRAFGNLDELLMKLQG